MRIGVDATFIGSEKPTGLAIYTRNIVNELLKMHTDLVLWASDGSGFSIPGEYVRTVLDEFAFLGQHRFIVRPVWMELFFSSHIQREQVDILFSTVPGGMWSCPVPHVVTVHDLTPLAVPGDSPLSVQLNYRYRLGRILERCDAIIADSVWTREDICRFYGIPEGIIHVIPLGYDRDLFRPRHEPKILNTYGLKGIPYILAVGSDKPRKNLYRLVQSFGMMLDRVHYLALVGLHSKASKQRIMEVARPFGVGDRIRFLDYVKDEDLPVLYSGATLYCYPSLYEGFGLPVLEAMACGTPVVASNATSIPEVVGDAGILVDPMNCEEIAAAMDLIICNSDLRDSLRFTGLERVTNFSWERAAKETLSLIQRTFLNGSNSAFTCDKNRL
jgi:glycosyltransferase involved in cell wall biosynthesis